MDETKKRDPKSISATTRLIVFSVHILTALGGAFALFALLEAVREHWAAMFGWLGLALVIDGIDGPLARRLDAERVLPNWSGDTLDLVVDFVTYVFVPAYAITASGLLVSVSAPLLGSAIVVSGALYFADRRMKTDDNHFRGFPALWNAVAFYLFLLKPYAAIGSIVITLFVILTFVPFNVLHPLRTKRFRLFNIGLLAAGSAMAIAVLVADFNVPIWITLGLCGIGVYVLASDMIMRMVRVERFMIELLTSAEAWVALVTLTALEIVLGIDNVIFLSVLVARIPAAQAKRARQIGLALALIFRILLLSVLFWLIGLTEPVLTIAKFTLSWRDIILIGGGLFLIAKATHEIHAEVEARDEDSARAAPNAFFWVIVQIVIIDLVFSIDSIITAIGMAEHLEIMVAAVIIACAVMYISSGPVSAFIAEHPTTKMLALAFLVLIGVALVADGFSFHIPRAYIYFAITFSVAVEAFNILAKRSRKKKARPDIHG